MATHKQAIKRHRQSVKRRARNRSAKSEISTLAKKLLKVSKEEALELIKTLQSKIDKAARKGMLHEKTAARRVCKAMRVLMGK